MTKSQARAVMAHNKAGGAGPLIIEVWRGDLVESRHRVAVAVVDGRGSLVLEHGDIKRLVYPRSAVKPLQVLPLIESGAAAAFHVSDEEIALASASHSGEPGHAEVARRWLERLGLTADDLMCGTHAPLDTDAARDLTARSEPVSAVHNNCAGKHIAMLTTARHLGAPIGDYIAPDHPVQIRIRETIGELAACDVADAPVAVDGCSVPTAALTLDGLARAMAAFAAPGALPAPRSGAVRRVHAAMVAHPWLVAGTGRYCTAVIAGTEGRVLVKTGAEGVMVAALPGQGIGAAIKVGDGAKRAAEVAMTGVLSGLGLLREADLERLAAYIEAPVVNWRGVRTGTIRAAARAAPREG